MKTKVLMWMAATAMVLTLSQPASADPGSTVVVPFEFFAIGQGDLGGLCLNSPTSPVRPEAAAFSSCVRAGPGRSEGADHVAITVQDSQGQPVYFTANQGNNSAGGCGTLQWGDLSEDGLLPINGLDEILVFPWAGPGINSVLDPGGAACTGSLDTNIIMPGEVGIVTFVFHDHVA